MTTVSNSQPLPATASASNLRNPRKLLFSHPNLKAFALALVALAALAGW